VRGYGLNTPRRAMLWSERVALVSRELVGAQRETAIERHLASLSAPGRFLIGADDSPLGRFVRTRKITRRPLHSGRMRQSNG
jgi:hypothetical protein